MIQSPADGDVGRVGVAGPTQEVCYHPLEACLISGQIDREFLQIDAAGWP